MEFKEAWPKVLKLEAKKISDGKNLSRGEIRRQLNISEMSARFLYETLKNREIIAAGAGMTSDVKIRSELRSTKNKLKDAEQSILKLSRQVHLYATLSNMDLNPPRWLVPDVPKKKHAIACAAIGDTHFDEYVDPAEMMWLNGYDRQIATARLEQCFNSIVKLGRDYFSGVNIDGLAMMLVGDMVSGIIHEELASTNEFPITETLIYWSEQISAGMKMLLEHYKKLFVAAVVGNHGRLTPKVVYKGAVQNNFDYLLYHLISRELKNEKNITFHIPVSPDAYFPVYATRYCLTHGNQFRGGSGWAGPLMPIMRGNRKKQERQATVKKPYDVLVCGHFHTLKPIGTAVMNGSLVGYNEYAASGNFNFEPPQQAFWLTDAKHGMTLSAPIHCKCENESWENNSKQAVGIGS